MDDNFWVSGTVAYLQFRPYVSRIRSSHGISEERTLECDGHSMVTQLAGPGDDVVDGHGGK